MNKIICLKNISEYTPIENDVRYIQNVKGLQPTSTLESLLESIEPAKSVERKSPKLIKMKQTQTDKSKSQFPALSGKVKQIEMRKTLHKMNKKSQDFDKKSMANSIGFSTPPASQHSP
jgi:hypothetical protein